MSGRIGGIDDLAFSCAAIQRGDVVFGDATPVGYTLCIGPTLNTGKQTFNARTVAADRVTRCRSAVFVSTPIQFKHRNQILGTGKNEDIGLVDVIAR